MQVCAVRDKKLKIGIGHQMNKTHVVAISSSADCYKAIMSRAMVFFAREPQKCP